MSNPRCNKLYGRCGDLQSAENPAHTVIIEDDCTPNTLSIAGLTLSPARGQGTDMPYRESHRARQQKGNQKRQNAVKDANPVTEDDNTVLQEYKVGLTMRHVPTPKRRSNVGRWYRYGPEDDTWSRHATYSYTLLGGIVFDNNTNANIQRAFK